MNDPTPEEKAIIRRRIYERSGGYCEATGQRIFWNSFHLSHETSRGAGGDWSDENLMARHPNSHMIDKHNPKSIRRKDL